MVAESETVSVADRDPEVLGLNATEMLQLAEAPRLDPQLLLVIRKSPGSAPETEIPLIVIEEPVPLLNVAVCAPLVEPTLTDPKERELGPIVTEPLDPPEPSPVSATVCGEFVAESLKFSVAVRVPLAVGANTMLAVQLAPAARLDPQVFE